MANISEMIEPFDVPLDADGNKIMLPVTQNRITRTKSLCVKKSNILIWKIWKIWKISYVNYNQTFQHITVDILLTHRVEEKNMSVKRLFHLFMQNF